jgi:hypothetical protein
MLFPQSSLKGGLLSAAPQASRGDCYKRRGLPVILPALAGAGLLIVLSQLFVPKI